MNVKRAKRALAFTAFTALSIAIAIFAGVGFAQAASPPIRLVLASQVTNGLENAAAVAVDNDQESPEYGDVFITDNGNHRVQILNSEGGFVAMFGREVDATNKGDICTAASGHTCQAGSNGNAAGQFSAPYSIASDPVTGDVYVAEYVFSSGEFGLRVQKFTAEGGFLFEIGKEVNVTKDKESGATQAEKNLCSKEEIVTEGMECGGPTQEVVGGSEEGAFQFEQGLGDLLAVGGKGDKLYVGDEHRVQEFDSDGNPVGDITLSALSNEPEERVQALALEEASDNVYLVYASNANSTGHDVIREMSSEGEGHELSNFTVGPVRAGEEVGVKGIALDAAGQLAVVTQEGGGSGQYVGSLYSAADGRRIDGFKTPNGVFVGGIGFGATGDLYMTANNQAGQGEVLTYTPEVISELIVGGHVCNVGAEDNTSATFDCTLEGEVNPEGVSETEALFEWGRTPSLGERTASQTVAEPKMVKAIITLRPDETFFYQLAGYNHNIKPSEERFASQEASLTTQVVSPHVVGAPTTQVVNASSALLFGELNPENASTEYFFEYALAGEGALTRCAGIKVASCPGVMSTAIVKSAVYGKIGFSSEVDGLQPDTAYDYRLFAEDKNVGNTEKFASTGPEGNFTTASVPTPRVQTGDYSGLTQTGVVISGVVDPDGVAAGYTFELGIYNGVSTQYSTVSTGIAGSGTVPVEEALALTGLQPGTTYAYRIAVTSGYIADESHSVTGLPATFTTAGIPAALISPVPLAMLAVPPIAFPHVAKLKSLPKCRRGFTRNKRGRCARQKRKARKARK